MDLMIDQLSGGWVHSSKLSCAAPAHTGSSTAHPQTQMYWHRQTLVDLVLGHVSGGARSLAQPSDAAACSVQRAANGEAAAAACGNSGNIVRQTVLRLRLQYED